MEESKFIGGLLGYIGVGILSFLLIIFTLGIAAPWAIVIKEKWFVKNTIINGQSYYFDGNGTQLFGNYIKWLFLTIITFGIYSFWLVIKLKQWKVKHTHLIQEG